MNFCYWKCRPWKMYGNESNSWRFTLQLGSESIIILKLTDSIEINVEGKLSYSALNAPLSSKSFADLGNQEERNLQLSVNAVSFCIINEFATIWCCLMTEVKQRCHEVKSYSIPLFNVPTQSYNASGWTWIISWWHAHFFRK